MFSSFDYFFYPPTQRTVYVVSDAQLNDLKLKQRQEELDSISDQRKSLDDAYQARVKVLDDRETALQAELKALAPSEAKEKVAA
ncbi:MAG: hypothetical protein GY914_08460 [Prochlorococcus sp.]|nr:hypothetical protein [Prochlorococcus sp.]